MSNPLQSPQDYIVLAGLRSPGLCDISGAESLRSYKIFQPQFSTGFRMIYQRKEQAEFTVRFRFYTVADLEAFNLFRVILDAVPDVRRQPRGMDIQHPLLADLEIKAVVVKSISQLEQTGDTGEWSCTVKFLEHKDLPRPTLAQVEGAKAEPVDPVDLTIEAMRKQAEELANE